MEIPDWTRQRETMRMTGEIETKYLCSRCGEYRYEHQMENDICHLCWEEIQEALRNKKKIMEVTNE